MKKQVRNFCNKIDSWDMLEKKEWSQDFFQLCEIYSTPFVLNAIRNRCCISKVISVFSQLNWEKNNKESIKTIGTTWRKMYDGGVERVLASLVTLWVEMGYNVILFTEEDETDIDYPYSKSVKRVLIPSVKDLNKRLSVLQDTIISENIDAYINHDWCNPNVVYEYAICRLNHVYYLQHIHGHFSEVYTIDMEYSLWSNRFFAQCDAVLSLSNMNKEFYKKNNCQSYLVKNLIPDNIKNKEKEMISEPRVLWVGRIVKGKRVEDAIRAVAIVKESIPNIQLDIVGTGPKSDCANARKLVEKLRIDRNVSFYGYQDDVGFFYENAALLLMTSEKEGYSMTLIEGKAYGLPIVMYDLPYLALLEDKKGIVTAEIGDFSQLADNMVLLLKNKSEMKKMTLENKLSFEELKQYGYASQWKKIFNDLSNLHNKEMNKDIDENSLLEYSMMFESIMQGAQKHREYSYEYKLGYLLLQFAKKIKKLLKKYI